MTLAIATRVNGVVRVAADKKLVDSTGSFCNVRKIFQPHGYVVAMAGSEGQTNRFMQKFLARTEHGVAELLDCCLSMKPEKGGFELLLVDTNFKEKLIYTGGCGWWENVVDPVVTIGSGAAQAQGYIAGCGGKWNFKSLFQAVSTINAYVSAEFDEVTV